MIHLHVDVYFTFFFFGFSTIDFILVLMQGR